jgi:polysaccharide export outer membrane protein
LVLVPVLIQGCAFTPGLQVKAGPEGVFRAATPTEPEEEDNYILIPVNEQLVAKMEAGARPKSREVPPEWRDDASQYDYRVGRNDLLQVIVWDHPELSLQGTAAGADAGNPAAGPAAAANPGTGIRVNNQGVLFFPFVGAMHVAGKTSEEIRDMLKAALSRYVQDPQVDVRVIGFRSKKVHISGEVAQPRDVAITDVPLRLLDAINLAGGTAVRTGAVAGGTLGTTVKPDLEDIRIGRHGKEISLSLLDIYDRGQIEQNILLQDGDMIHVPTLDRKKIYVMGEVRIAGLTAFERGELTLASALQKSGGINQDTAEATRVLVIRRGKTKPLVYYFNANEPDTLVLTTRFPLKPNDIVYVATADITKFQRVVQAFMPIIQTAIFAGAFAAGGN